MTPAWPQTEGDPLAHGDRARSLYRVAVSLDASGHPVLPLAALQGQRQVTVEASTGVRVLGTGDGTVELRVPAGKTATVRAIDFHRGRKLYWVGVGRAPAGDLDSLRTARKFWQDQGIATKPLTLGATFALAGRVLDTRETVLAVTPACHSAAEAEAKAAAWSDKYGRDAFVHVVVESPPGATLIVDIPGGALLRAADVLWFEALPDAQGRPQPLVVQGADRRLELPGRIYVAPGDGGGFDVVNEARIETILEGVVASEIFPQAPMEALKAQAVAARTDMLAKVGLRHHADPFSICSEVHCQAYRGLTKVNARVAEAVRATAGQVLVGGDGRLVDTFYHAVSGGHTEHNDNAWRMAPHPSLRGQPDWVGPEPHPLAAGHGEREVGALLAGPDRSWAAASGKNQAACRWEATVTAATVQAGLARHGWQQPLRDFKVLQRGSSGRVIHAALVLADGSERTIWGELLIRRIFGGLRSSLALWVAGPRDERGVPQRWTVRGAGFGHGVGMDQTGAVGRAAAGQRFEAILAAYYAGARLEKLY